MKQPGFSLFEVLVAMTVCVSGIALILGVLQRADQFTERGRNRIEQQILCQNLVHRLRLGIEALPDTRKTESTENDAYWYSLTRSPYPPLPLTRVEVSVWPKTKLEMGVSIASGSAQGSEESSLAATTENPSQRFTLVFLMPTDNTSGSGSLETTDFMEETIAGDREGISE